MVQNYTVIITKLHSISGEVYFICLDMTTFRLVRVNYVCQRHYPHRKSTRIHNNEVQSEYASVPSPVPAPPDRSSPSRSRSPPTRCLPLGSGLYGCRLRSLLLEDGKDAHKTASRGIWPASAPAPDPDLALISPMAVPPDRGHTHTHTHTHTI